MKSAHAGRAALIALLAVGVFGWAISGAEVFLRLAYPAALLLLGSALWARQAIRGIHLRRTTRLLRAAVGEVVEERFEVTNLSHWPCLWLEVRNQSPLPLAGGSRLLTNLSPRSRRFYTVRHLLLQRGIYPLGPTLLISGDLFGLFPSHRLILADSTLLVLPMLFELPYGTLPAGPLPGGRSAHLKTSDITPHAAGLREYAPGDPLKRVHWPATAHHNRFIAKEFEQESEAATWIFLDAQRAVQVGRPPQPLAWDEQRWLPAREAATLAEQTFEYAISAAASLARSILRQHRPLGLACSTARPLILPPERGERQLNRILETLALLQANGELPFASLIAQQGRLLPRGSQVILITPTVQTGLIAAIEYIQSHHLYPFILLLEAESFGGPSGSRALANALQQRGASVCLLACGDNLSRTLYWETPLQTT